MFMKWSYWRFCLVRPRKNALFSGYMIFPLVCDLFSLLSSTKVLLSLRTQRVNSDLRYMIWDSPPGMEPHFLNTTDFDQMAQSGAAFARQFKNDDPVRNMVDERILKRGRNRPSQVHGPLAGKAGSWILVHNAVMSIS
ncbi:hypothetical protein FEM48_Zijuj10G0128900 [Ziziphus jujuba var. spinosa]|uniref:Uncharacterized protein n=1 Tax=Ziziphus jujuba var. spinosa TaxID=714518 RepID=A0A978UNH7_ZIZJJ|nr:hypothetical protein FEM48_Zijuj10G0128900 [Ziziphus jujuba var. spinosa]